MKEPASFEEQYNKLLEKGCRIEDELFCKQVLERVSYYRLSAYFMVVFSRFCNSTIESASISIT